MSESCTRLQLGPFTAAITTPIEAVMSGIDLLYPRALRRSAAGFADFHVELRPGRGARRWLRPQARFFIDGEEPFKPLPLDQAMPMLEWGLNYGIAGLAHQYLILHAAAIEKDGRVALLPAAPGAGKSTLAAALVSRGWRLLSDELALIRRSDGWIVPLARPISLKNESIGLLRRFAPDAIFGPPAHDTVKGTVALMRAPEESILRIGEAAPPGWIVFPKWKAGDSPRLVPSPKAAALMDLALNALNYSIQGATGFRLLADIVERCACRRFSYSALDDAVAVFTALEAG